MIAIREPSKTCNPSTIMARVPVVHYTVLRVLDWGLRAWNNTDTDPEGQNGHQISWFFIPLLVPKNRALQRSTSSGDSGPTTNP